MAGRVSQWMGTKVEEWKYEPVLGLSLVPPASLSEGTPVRYDIETMLIVVD